MGRRWSKTCFLGRLLPVLLMLALPLPVLAACEAELGQLEAGLPADMPPGTLAAQLLMGAVELAEPALPPLNAFAELPLDPGTPGYGAARWLLDRGLLPDAWLPDELDPGTWRHMLAHFLDWYALELPAAGAGGEDLVADLAAVLDQVAASVRPVVIIAHDANQEVEFVGILWNWTTYPRLIVKRVAAGTSVADGPDELLSGLGNCAVAMDRYALAPVDTAWRLFVGSGESTMYLLATDPDRPGLPLPVEQADVREYLEFKAPRVAGSLEFSAAFSGQEIGLGAILGMITQLRTNISPFAVPRYLEVPPLR